MPTSDGFTKDGENTCNAFVRQPIALRKHSGYRAVRREATSYVLQENTTKMHIGIGMQTPKSGKEKYKTLYLYPT